MERGLHNIPIMDKVDYVACISTLVAIAIFIISVPIAVICAQLFLRMYYCSIV